MSPEPTDLSHFLLARAADDERTADLHEQLLAQERGLSEELLALLARPERLRRDAEATRRIVDWCSARERIYVGRLRDDPSDPENYVPGELVHKGDAPVLRLLALPWADHPDYRAEWRP